MAAGPVTVFDRALTKIGAGLIDLDSDTFAVVLTTNAQAIGASFAGASTNAVYSDLTAQVVGTGYTAGGDPMTGVTWTRSGGVVTFNADASAWSALTATMKYAVIVRTTGGTPSDLLAFVDLETGDPAGRSSAGGDFIINWTGGLFTLSRA